MMGCRVMHHPLPCEEVTVGRGCAGSAQTPLRAMVITSHAEDVVFHAEVVDDMMRIHPRRSAYLHAEQMGFVSGHAT